MRRKLRFDSSERVEDYCLLPLLNINLFSEGRDNTPPATSWLVGFGRLWVA